MIEDWQKGLTSREAMERRKRYGWNEIVREKRLVGLKILLSQFMSPLVYVLLLAAGITFLLGDLVDMGVILMAVLVNTILGFIQEYKAERSLEALNQVLAPRVKVYRDGILVDLPAREVVPGDVVFLSDEHKVPADGILLDEDGLFTIEAVLTGEGAPVEKYDCEDMEVKLAGNWEDIAGRFGVLDNKYKAFMGTVVKMGVGRMLVIRTGVLTQVGKVAKSLKETPEEKTPLQLRISRLSKQLALLVGVISALILGIGLARGSEFVEMFTTAVALAVSAIPEGLAVSLTAILAIGTQRILKQKALARKLMAAETLGSVDVVCADKTGTLTEGVMSVTQAVGKKADLVMAAVLCNDLRDPLELGMYEWAEKQNHRKEDNAKIREKHKRIDSIPFTSANKFIATLHQAEGKEKWLYLSGAPEVVLKRSVVSPTEAKEWGEKFREMGRQGFRLVGFAMKPVAKMEKVEVSDLEGFKWLGFLVYEDSVRSGVADAIRQVQEAGVTVKVITGDYRETAVAILRQIGLLGEDVAELVMEGEEVEGMSQAKLEEVIDRVVLFARTNPEQKLKIVEALKARDHVVAMTGDGVNDAPALKRADIGIVVSGATDVAKETADMVLLDNNFKTIVEAIKEGRGIYDNLKKIIVYLLADSFAEILVVTASIFLGWPLPIVAVQILWINLISDGFPNLALTVEPRDRDVLKMAPRKRSEQLIDSEVIVLIGLISSVAAITTLVVFAYYWQATDYGLTWARTVAFAMLGVNSLFYVFSSRSLSKPIWRVNLGSNPWLLGAALAGFGLQVAVIYVPELQQIFETVGIGINEWLVIVAGSVLLMIIVEGVKFVYSPWR